MTTPIVRIVLVGFMGAGKSTVGRRIAGALAWRFVDLDDAVERSVGRSVPRIFEEDGEEHFRSLEARVASQVLLQEGVVVASGGGWGAHPGRLEALPAGTLSIWLEVEAEDAVLRAGSQDEGRARPLLAGDDPVATARSLLRRRTPHYAEAAERVDTTGRSLDDVTARILGILENHGLNPSTE